MDIHTLKSPIDCVEWPTATALPALEIAGVHQHKCDAHCVVTDNEKVSARCSLWWKETPRWNGRKTGLIGHFAAQDNVSAVTLLENACHKLREQDCDIAVGPMNQNTWRDYRCIVDETHGSRFFLENTWGQDVTKFFQAADFQQVESFFSALAENLSICAPRLESVRSRLREQQIFIRGVELSDLDLELARIHHVAEQAFCMNPFFSSMPQDDFVKMYAPLRAIVPTDFILLAEQASEPVGFCFAVPDVSRREQGLAVDTVVVKTLGVIPKRRLAGLGQILLEAVHHRAASHGMNRAIHALVRDSPHLRRISQRYATPFRLYGLFGRSLNG